MSNGTSKEIKIKLKPVEAISKSDFSSVGGTVYTYEIAYTDYITKVVVAGVEYTKDVSVVAADPDLADSTWAQYNGILYVGDAGWGGNTRKVVVTYELYFSETGVYDYRNIETSDGGTVFYTPHIIKRPTFQEILTSDSFGFIPSATTSVTIAHDGLSGRLDHWFRNKPCNVYDGSIVYKMIMTGSLSVNMPDVNIQIADQRELFNNESLELVGEKYFGDESRYFKGVKVTFGEAVLDGYDENLNGEPIPAYLGLVGGVKAINVAYTPGEVPVNHATTSTENDKDFFNNSAYWIPNPGYYYNLYSGGAGRFPFAGGHANPPLFVTENVTSGTRVKIANISNYTDVIEVGDPVFSQTVTAVGADYIDLSGAVTKTVGDPVTTTNDYRSYGILMWSSLPTAGATSGTLTYTEGLYVGCVFGNNSMTHAITSINRDTNVVTFTPALGTNISSYTFSWYPFNSLTLVKNGKRIELDLYLHCYISYPGIASGYVVHCTSGGTTINDETAYGLGWIICINWYRITQEFGFELDGSEEVYVSGVFGGINGSSQVNAVAAVGIQEQLTLNGDLINPRDYNGQNYNRTLSPAHAGWLLYTYLRRYVGIDEDDIDTDSFLTIDVIDYGVALSGGRLHRDVINEILKECMLRMFINASGKWELAKVSALGAADYTISDFIKISQKYNSLETYGRIHVKYREAGNTYNLYTYDAQETQDAIDENRILQLDTNFSSVDNPTLMAPRYAAVHGYKKGVTELVVSKRYSNILINDVVTVTDNMFEGGSKNFVVIAINRQDDTITLTLDDQLGIEENSSVFDTDDDLEGEV